MRIIVKLFYILLTSQLASVVTCVALAQAPGQTSVNPQAPTSEQPLSEQPLKVEPPSRSNDIASVSFINYDSRGDQALEARTGVPPLRIGKVMLINSLSYRHTNLSSDKVPAGEDLMLSDYGFGTMFIAPLKDWTIVARGGVNFANADSSLRIQRESTFYNSVVVGSRSFRSDPYWKYSLGIVVLGKGSRVPAVPVVGFEYSSEGQVYQLQIGFPAIQASYGISDKSRIGLFSAFTSSSYLLPEDSALRANGDYIGVDRIVLGTLARVRLTEMLWLNTRLGYSVYGKTVVLGSNLKERYRLDEESGLYFLMGLGLSLPRS